MSNLKFEWDEKKAAANLRKHRVSFPEAATIWDDPNRIESDDDEHSEAEDRVKTIGASEKLRLLLVVYTQRNETIRLISARRTTTRETESYTEEILGA